MQNVCLRFAVLLSAVAVSVSVLAEEPTGDPKRTPVVLPGMQASGKILLPNQWSLRPAGKQLKMGDFPVNIALHPTEPFAAVLHAGYGDHEVVIV